MKKVLLVVRNGNNLLTKNQNVKALNRKRGSELAQTVLITAIMITIIAALFFPQFKALFETAMTHITTWFNDVMKDIAAI